MDIDFDVKKVFQDKLASSMGLDRYKIIMESIFKTDVSSDNEFQRLFNGFYMVRRNTDWRKIYYNYFESIKNTKPTFSNIITYIYEKTGNVEPSFSSKMLATICAEKPIWDRYVVQNLELELVGKTPEEKLSNAIELYRAMEEWYSNFMNTDKAHDCIKEFDAVLPDYCWVSDVKKIDAILWSIR